MKRKSFLALLAVGCLFSCQQQDEVNETSNDAINFSISTDDHSMISAYTRSNDVVNPTKSSFTTGDVISMAASDLNYTPFVIGEDSRTWSEIASTSNAVKFYAHYPALSEDNIAATRTSNYKRQLKGGNEHWFGIAETNYGTQNVTLKLQRMTVPVLLLDENNNPYDGDAKVELYLKNEGVQDLLNGKIIAKEDVAPETINVKKVSEGIVTNLLPQTIEAGEVIGTLIIDGEKKTIQADQDYKLQAGNTFALRLSKFNRPIIIDGNIPLRR